MKIFKVTESEWCAAETAEDALKAWQEYADMVGYDEADREEFLAEFGEPHEITVAQYDEFVFHDDDQPVLRTFRQELDRRLCDQQKFPQFFATTEY